MAKLTHHRAILGVLIIAIIGLGVVFSPQPTPARSDDSPTLRLVESDDSAVQRSGNWTAQAANGASGSSYLYSGKSVDDTLTLEFVGSRVEVVYVQNSALGALAIEIDGTVLRTVMTDGAEPEFGNRAVINYLDDGPHTLKVYPQEGSIVAVDAFYIPSGEATAESTPEESAPTGSTPVPQVIDTEKLGESVIAAAQAQNEVRVIVQLRTPSTPLGNVPFNARLNADMQTSVLDNIDAGRFDVIHQYKQLSAFAGTADLAALIDLQANPLVESIIIDEPSEMHTGQSVPGIQANLVHSSYGLRGRGVTVAVIDSGIDTNHPDLSDDLIAQRCYNTAPNPADGSSICPPSNTAVGVSAEDQNGHGTNVSGVITANGVVAPVGFAPDAKIVAIRALRSNGSGFVSDWVFGLDYILDNQNILNVDIINLSLGTNAMYAPGNCASGQPTVELATMALFNSGVTIFASSGNQGNTTSMASPACNGGVIAVGATYDSDLGREPDAGTYQTLFPSFPACFDNSTNLNVATCFTNVSSDLDIFAPGSQITSAGMGGGTSTYRGTSQASPTAAAVAALMIEANPSITPSQIETILESSGVPVTRAGITRNRINAMNAVQNPLALADAIPGAPSNDLFANATVISSLPYRRAQDVYQATVTGTDPSGAGLCGVANRSDTVWYRYTPLSTQLVSISTEASTYDTVVGVFTGTEGSLTPVACGDDDFDGISIRSSAVNFAATGGVTYRIMVAKFSSTPLAAPAGLRLSVSTIPVGDTIAIFNSTTNAASLIDSLQTPPATANYATYPTGFGTTGAQWVMGDWDGNGQKTPGVYSAGAFYFTNNIGYTTTWSSIWIGLVGRPVVAGKFSGASNDCIGAIDSANFPPFGIAYAMYFTCNFTGGPTPTLTFQWLSVLLPDSQGHTGTPQFTAGDWDNDASRIDSIAIRRSGFIAFTNTPPTTQNAEFTLAQFFGAPSAVSYGTLVSGDWDSNNIDSFGLVYSNGAFYRRNDLDWNSATYILQNLGQPVGTINWAAAWRQR